jgi:hypothetical protein
LDDFNVSFSAGENAAMSPTQEMQYSISISISMSALDPAVAAYCNVLANSLHNCPVLAKFKLSVPLLPAGMH